MALSDDIFYLNAAERSEAFEELYFHKFGRHADSIKEEIWEKTLAGINKDKVLLDELMRGSRGHCHGNNVTEEESMKIMKRWLSKQVVQKTFEKAGTHTMEPLVKGALTDFYKLVHAASEFGSLLPGISALIVQTVADVVVDKGATDFHAGNVSIKVGTIEGAHEALHDRHAIRFSGRGKITDNWAYIKTGSVQGTICVGTYCSIDSLYWKTYWNECRGSYCDMFVMSAGQERMGSFQVRVWDSSNGVICHLDKVFFRDFIHVGRKPNGCYCVAHGKGELWGTKGGTVSIHP